MRTILKQKIISVSNENNEPDLLMEVAQWWIKTHRLNHFEKATKIKEIVENS